eukprot:423133-Rhodomonas_salina.1
MRATSGVIAGAPRRQSLLDAGGEWARGGAADDTGGGARVGPEPVERGERDLDHDALGQDLWRERLRGGARGG